MSSLQGIGLAAALLAASGGLAFASWSYISTRRQRRTAAPDIAPVHEQGHGREQLGCIPVPDGDSGEDPVPDSSPVQQQWDRREHLGCIPVPDGDNGEDPDIASLQQGDEEEELGHTPVLDGEKGAGARPDVTPVQKEDQINKSETGSIPVLEEDKTATPGTTHLYEGNMSANQDFSPVQREEERTGPSPLLDMGDKREASDRTSVEPPVEKEITVINSSAEIQHKGKTSQVLVLGLDGSGKTSVLNSIAANRGKQMTTPTEGVNAMCLNNGNSKMEFLEIGGSEQLRPYWKMYLSRAFAVIFVVDSADHSRLPLAKRHLHQLIQQDSVLPLIVLANKQDLENAYHIPEIHDALALSEICENRKLFLIGTHVTKDGPEISSGIQDAKEFISQLQSENSSTIT
ncbi:ADP-ribosylation factor-like protein 9 [Pseudophryne corroboree]|uniref:ADP-ribosylation factor-like protein 9 n=1 Tax=Pseudophryne corroboree TaxID=495146 RepID=UPI003081C4BA